MQTGSGTPCEPPSDLIYFSLGLIWGGLGYGRPWDQQMPLQYAVTTTHLPGLQKLTTDARRDVNWCKTAAHWGFEGAALLSSVNQYTFLGVANAAVITGRIHLATKMEGDQAR